MSLLGTGAPSPGMQRFGPSTLVEAGRHKLLFDAGRRVDCAGRSVVLSGDTRLSPNLIRHAQGVDLLVHEVVAPSIFHGPASVIEHHTTPAQAGEVFARTKPRLAVYSHIVPPTATEKDLIPPTRKSYPGPVVVGEDLMVIDVGEKIGIHRFGRTASTTRKDGSD